MNTTILLFLLQDGITNGAIYALLGLALVLVFAVTRVILIPQGEFVTYGALTYATLAAGQVPGTARLAVAMGFVAFCLDIISARKSLNLRRMLRALGVNILLPLAVLALTKRAIAGPVPWPAARLSAAAALEILHCPLVLFRGRARGESTEVPASPGIWVLLSRVEAVFARFQFADHRFASS